MNNANSITNNTINHIVAGDRLVLTKGCKARGLDKGITVRVESVAALGAEYGHSVKVVIQPLNGFKAGSKLSFFARHMNRLSDSSIRVNDGNPSHTIEMRRSTR